LQVEVGGAGGRWGAKAAKKQVGQSRLQVSAVTVLGRDGQKAAKKGDDPGQLSSGRCKWRSKVRLGRAQSGGGGSSQKNASGGWRCSQSQRSQKAEPVACGGRRCRWQVGAQIMWQLERRSSEEGYPSCGGAGGRPSGSFGVLRSPGGSLWGPLGVPSGLLSGAVGPVGISLASLWGRLGVGLGSLWDTSGVPLVALGSLGLPEAARGCPKMLKTRKHTFLCVFAHV